MLDVPPAQESDFTAEELDAAAVDMDRILTQEPRLNDYGFGFSPGYRTLAEREAYFHVCRETIREPRSLAQFIAARGWLRQFPRLKSINRRTTSYGLKHVAAHDIGYVTNGVFIAAAIAEGFVVQRAGNGPNAWFNISAQAWARAS
jgi:hypothetical protein